MKIKNIILRYFPQIGIIKRIIIALIDHSLPIKASYSQHAEDTYILNIIKNEKILSGIYIDVGANHPTRISNTYLLYRNKFYGICIEPNVELINLHKLIRRKDIQIISGCGDTNKLSIFNNYNIPVLSGFKSETTIYHNALRILSKTYIPVLTIDTIMENLPMF